MPFLCAIAKYARYICVHTRHPQGDVTGAIPMACSEIKYGARTHELAGLNLHDGLVWQMQRPVSVRCAE